MSKTLFKNAKIVETEPGVFTLAVCFDGPAPPKATELLQKAARKYLKRKLGYLPITWTEYGKKYGKTPSKK